MRHYATDMEALAVLRHELDYWRARGCDAQASAISAVIEILEGRRAPHVPPASPMYQCDGEAERERRIREWLRHG